MMAKTKDVLDAFLKDHTGNETVEFRIAGDWDGYDIAGWFGGKWAKARAVSHVELVAAADSYSMGKLCQRVADLAKTLEWMATRTDGMVVGVAGKPRLFGRSAR